LLRERSFTGRERAQDPLDDDRPDGVLWGVLKPYGNVETPEKAKEKAEGFQKNVHHAEELARRACQLAMDGVPVDGGHFLIRNDPFINGQKQFQTKCAACHSFTAQDWDKDAKGHFKFKSMTDGKSASDLGAFGTAEWIRGLLNNPMDAKFFGLVKRDKVDAENKPVLDEKGKVEKEPGLTMMHGWRERINKARKAGKIDAKEQDKDFDRIAALLQLNARTPRSDREKKNENIDIIEAGQKAFLNDDVNKCSTCHLLEIRMEKGKWAKEGDITGPDLTDWGSADWIRGMIMRPGHVSRYRDRNLMPAFRNKEGPGSEILFDEFREANKDVSIIELSDIEREMIIRWILRDYRPVFGGAPIAK